MTRPHQHEFTEAEGYLDAICERCAQPVAEDEIMMCSDCDMDGLCDDCLIDHDCEHEIDE